MDVKKLKTPFMDLLPPLSTEEFAALKASIKADGIREAIIIDEDGNILDGHHRYKIDKKAPTRTLAGLSDAEKQAYVYQSNFLRRNLSPAQKKDKLKAMKKIAKALREEDPKKNTQANIAARLGVSRPTVEHWFGRDAKSINNDTSIKANTRPDARVKIPPKEKPVIAARVASGETQKQVAADYGVTQGQVSNIVTAKVKKRSAEKQKRPVVCEDVVSTLEELIEGSKKFKTIYADPPWSYGNQATRAATSNHYDGMGIEEICALPVGELVGDEAHLHLWTTNAFLFEAKRVIEAWGFEYKSVLLWVKPQMGIGNYWRVCHEFLLFGNRGKLPMSDAHTSLRSWHEIDRGKHSVKPAHFRQLIEQVSPPPRLEMFAREAHTGWAAYGNEIVGAEMWHD